MTPAAAPRMTEDELMQGITDALEIAGWRWMHIRRSDGVTVGSDGFPDIVAVHPSRPIALLLELKGTGGTPTFDQAAWLTAARDRRIVAELVTPADYDDTLRVIFAPGSESATIAAGVAEWAESAQRALEREGAQWDDSRRFAEAVAAKLWNDLSTGVIARPGNA